MVSKFELQPVYYIHFSANILKKKHETFYSPAQAMGYIIPLFFFYIDSYGLIKPINVDMPSDKETKPNTFFLSFFNGISTFVGYLMPKPFSL